MSQQPELTGNEAPEEGEEKKKKKQVNFLKLRVY